MRYKIINLLFRLRFPSGFITATDFRPHFDGHLINVRTTIPAGFDSGAVEIMLSQRLRESFRWMRLLRFLLRPGDEVQYCIGTVEPLQLYLKAWSSKDDLVAAIQPHHVAEYWRRA